MKWLRAYTVGVLIFLWAPLLAVLWKGASWDGLSRLMGNGEVLQSFENSLILAAGTAAISLGLGLATAFALPAIPPRLRRWVLGTLILPLVLPEIAFGLAYLIWYQSVGIPLGWTTLLLSHVGFTFCYVVLVLRTGVAQLDPHLSEAAQDLGAPPLSVFRHGILPQLLPSLAAALMLAFSLSLDDFLVSFFVKGIDEMTLPIKLYSMMRLKVGPEIYSLCLVLFSFSLISVTISQLWLRKKSR